MSEKLWGGRFESDIDRTISRFNASILFDQRLYAVDIEGSIAHAEMLGATGIIGADEAAKIVNGLKLVKDDIENDPSILTEAAEDIHMNVETLLRAKIGPVAGKLHTARSRNDQVATDLRLWVKSETAEIEQIIVHVQLRLVQLSAENIDHILPGLTHLQHAQPIRLGHHFMAYFWMMERDKIRFRRASEMADTLPLGSGALAGTTFPIDRQLVASKLGFAEISPNSLDAVSDRDFALDMIQACAVLMVHLSRFSEELILWSSPEFGFAVMGDAVTTGSSIMPQKKNPDVPELIRGKAGRVFGDLMSLLTTMKGLPLAYNKDMQEDKEALFDAVDTAKACLSALLVVLNDIQFEKVRMAKSLEGDFSTATDLADYLVTKGLPFRDAHEVVGKIVGECVRTGVGLEKLTSAELTAFSQLFEGAPEDIASVEASVERRNVPGGTAKEAVLAQIAKAQAILDSAQ